MKDLTPGQMEVLKLIAEGYDYTEIAKEIHKSFSTVRHHASMAYQTLDARDAAHAVHIAHQRGLL